MPDVIHHIRQWSRHRQCLGQQGKNAEEVLKAITGVYSTHPSGPLSLFARVKISAGPISKSSACACPPC
ncbi:MAG: hypothetical protein KDD01_24415, partial [Phaeodactylibacter sp.]|nr:hypothetical protein [Phaeodactylibacter sp.]